MSNKTTLLVPNKFKPVVRNVTINFLEDYKKAQRGTVFEVINLDGEYVYFMKFTQKYMMRLDNLSKRLYHYDASRVALVGKDKAEHSTDVFLKEHKVASWEQVIATITISKQRVR